MRKIILAALAAGVVAAPAFAQNASPFTGPRVEGLIGYDALGDSDGDGDKVEGVGFGVGAGYDFDAGGVVLGVEGEFMESTGKEDSTETIQGFPFRGSVETGRDLYLGARVGVRAAPTTLVYAKGGYTNTSIEARYEDDTDRFELDANADGWRLGAGVEQVFGRKAYGKLEYRYSNYNKLDQNAVNLGRDIDLDRHQVVAGVGVRF